MAYKNITLVGAYGRDYKSAKEILAAWATGIDFQIYGGPYCSCRDIEHFKKEGYTHIHFRYQRMTRVHVVKL